MTHASGFHCKTSAGRGELSSPRPLRTAAASQVALIVHHLGAGEYFFVDLIGRQAKGRSADENIYRFVVIGDWILIILSAPPSQH